MIDVSKMIKKAINAVLATVFVLSMSIACSEEQGYVPVSLDSATLSYEAGPGTVTLFWNIPDDADYYYVRVNYTTPEGDCMRSASIYADSLKVDNLLNAYGPITFTLTTVSKDGTEGDTSCTITAQADPVERTEVLTTTALTLSSDGLWTDAQEPSEGPIANLIDGDATTFFHMNWSSPVAFPHYIIVDLGKEVTNIMFSYTCRNNANCNNPKEMELYATTSFDGKTFDETSFDAELLGSLSDLPAGQAASYTSGQYEASTPFRYLWFKVLSEVNGNKYIALAELSVSEWSMEVEDPEQEYIDSHSSEN